MQFFGKDFLYLANLIEKGKIIREQWKNKKATLLWLLLPLQDLNLRPSD
jgi:hypothetical protein